MNSTRLDVGIHPNVPEAIYHSDPAVEISASASILRTLYNASPEHAWNDHPRLNPAAQHGPSTDAQATGTILHAAILGTPAPYVALSFDSFRTDAAKKARDAVAETGLIPILQHKLDEILPVGDALRARLQREHPTIFAAITDPETMREATMIWRENGIICRCRFDTLPPARYKFTADLKFTGRSAEPEEWSKKLRTDYLFQSGLYPRAVKALRGDTPEFRFVVCETDPPYGVSVHALGPELIPIAERRVNVALAQWARCLQDNAWPGYPPLVHYAEAPGWLMTQDDDRAIRDSVVAKYKNAAGIAAADRFFAETGSPVR